MLTLKNTKQHFYSLWTLELSSRQKFSRLRFHSALQMDSPAGIKPWTVRLWPINTQRKSAEHVQRCNVHMLKLYCVYFWHIVGALCRTLVSEISCVSYAAVSLCRYQRTRPDSEKYRRDCDAGWHKDYGYTHLSFKLRPIIAISRHFR